MAEGMNSAKALRLEVTGVFQEQQEGRCGCNRMSKGRGRERQARERRRARRAGPRGPHNDVSLCSESIGRQPRREK